MQKAYFVYQDPQSASRQSDGVEFCFIPDLRDDHIYFYCSEYSVFWREIAEVGDFNEVFNYKPKKEIRPATLKEICEKGLAAYVSTVKEYNIEAGNLKGITYIHL